MNNKLSRIVRYLFLLIIVCFTLYSINKETIEYNKDKQKYEDVLVEAITINKIDVISKLQQEFNNNDIIGTIKINGTDIDTMLVQTINNDYYLSHSYDKSYNTMGSIFLDYRNNINDQKLLIYGHNFRYKEGSFHQLTKYSDKSFYDNYPYIEINLNNKIYKYQIFSVLVAIGKDYPHMKLNFNTKDKWIEHLSWMKNNSIYDTNLEVNENDYIITLQTCYYEPVGSYLIINAKRI